MPSFNDGPRITRRLPFCAGHRVLGHESKCANLHGHNYVAEITVRAPEGLDSLGRVIDFSVVKQLVGGWIDKYWDHNMILHAQDPLLAAYDNEVLLSHQSGVRAKDIFFAEKKPFIMPGNRNTTAEEMAHLLYVTSVTVLPSHIIVDQVRLYETENCWADYRPPFATADQEADIEQIKKEIEELKSDRDMWKSEFQRGPTI